MDLDPALWQGRRVLVTGHTGFKGSWLTLWLHRLGAELLGYSLAPPTSPSLYELANVGGVVSSVRADIRDLATLREAFASFEPEIVFHLAAQSLVRESYREPRKTYDVNVLGTANVLEAARSARRVQAVVVVTSDKCYAPRSTGPPFVESDPLGGADPYSSSKACAEFVTASYRASFFNAGPPVATARAGNVIGGGDWARDRLVPDAIAAFLDGRPLAVRNPEAVRPWQHVLEPLSGYVLLAQRLASDPAAATAWNFGPADTDAVAVRAVVNRLVALWGNDAVWAVDEGDHPAETPQLRLNATKAMTELGWSPRWRLDDALEHVVEWYRAYAAGADLHRATLEQIERFTAQQPITATR